MRELARAEQRGGFFNIYMLLHVMSIQEVIPEC